MALPIHLFSLLKQTKTLIATHLLAAPLFFLVLLLLFGPSLNDSSATAQLLRDALLPNEEQTNRLASLPLADPVLDRDATFMAQRSTMWQDAAGHRYLYLEGDVGFRFGSYRFDTNQALVQIITERAPGLQIYHIALAIDEHRIQLSTDEQSAVGARGDGLMVTVSTVGDVQLKTNLNTRVENPPNAAFILESGFRIDHFRSRTESAVVPLVPNLPLHSPGSESLRQAIRAEIDGNEPTAQLETDRYREILAETGRDAGGAGDAAGPAGLFSGLQDGEMVLRTTDDPNVSVLPVRGLLRFNAERIVVDDARPEEGRDNITVMLIGNVRVVYQDYQAEREATLRAERVVIFVDPGGSNSTGRSNSSGSDGPDSDADAEGLVSNVPTLAGNTVQAASVRGIYLEDNAIMTDGNYTVRAPRVYYDLLLNRAILLEAVLYTYDVRRQLPLYVRASVLRQTSATSFSASDALLTTSEFGKPHFAIRADRVAVRQVVDPQDQTLSDQFVKAQGAGFQWGDATILPLPTVAGRVTDLPLRSVRVGGGDGGVTVQTEWDLFGLADREAPAGVDLTGNADFRGDHGPAAGIDLTYDRPNFYGNLEAYLIPHTDENDDIAERLDVSVTDDTRGYFHAQHRQYLPNDLELSLELSYVSDETFLETFERGQAEQGRAYETGFALSRQWDDKLVQLDSQFNLNDFISQTTTLQSPGYTVDRLPELGYYQTGTSLWDDRLTWFMEARAGRVRIQPGDDTPLDRGFTNAQSNAAFGQNNNVTYSDQLAALGVPTDWRTRIDVRSELAAPLAVGDINVIPYVTGRITAYDHDFSTFSATGEDDQARFWGAAGVRIATQLHRDYAGFNLPLFDVQGIRHIFEPSLDFSIAATTLDSSNLPVYDSDVEALAEGSTLRFGLRNVFQTQRGGMGRWRTVDWLVVQTDLVLRGSDADDLELPRYFDSRPEYSRGGDHFFTDIHWHVTDALGINGELTYRLDDTAAFDEGVPHWRIGATLQHTRRLMSNVNYEELDAIDERLLGWGFVYDLTEKYDVAFNQRFDLADHEGVRDWEIALNRDLPRWSMQVFASRDEVDDETVFGFLLIPDGVGGSSRSRVFDY